MVDYISCWQSLLIAIDKEKEIRASGEYLHPYPKIEHVVPSAGFKFASYTLSVCYLVFVFIEVSRLARPDSDPGDLVMPWEMMFIGVIVVELYLKYICYGWIFFTNRYTFLELVVVFTSFLETFIFRQLYTPLIFRFGRILVCRIFELGKDLLMKKRYEGVFSPLRHIRMFFLGFAYCFKSLLWLYVMFFFVIFCVGVLVTEFITYGAGFENFEWVDEYFGNVFRSTFTMLQIATLDDWSAITRKLATKDTSTAVTGFMIIFVSLTNWTFLSLITAVLIDGALHAGKVDEVSEDGLRREGHKKVVQEFANLLEELEVKPGVTTKDDFNAARVHPSITRSMASVCVSKGDLVDIWNLLDNGTGEVLTSKYVDAFLRWSDTPAMGDMMVLMRKIGDVSSEIYDMNAYLQNLETDVEKLQSAFQKISGQQEELIKVLKKVGAVEAPNYHNRRAKRKPEKTIGPLNEEIRKMKMKEQAAKLSLTYVPPDT